MRRHDERTTKEWQQKNRQWCWLGRAVINVSLCDNDIDGDQCNNIMDYGIAQMAQTISANIYVPMSSMSMLASVRSAVVLVYLWFRLNALKRFNSKLTIFPIDSWLRFSGKALAQWSLKWQLSSCKKMRKKWEQEKIANIYRQFNLIKFRTFIVRRGQFSIPSAIRTNMRRMQNTHYATISCRQSKYWPEIDIVDLCVVWRELRHRSSIIGNRTDWTNVRKNRFLIRSRFYRRL